MGRYTVDCIGQFRLTVVPVAYSLKESQGSNRNSSQAFVKDVHGKLTGFRHSADSGRSKPDTLAEFTEGQAHPAIVLHALLDSLFFYFGFRHNGFPYSSAVAPCQAKSYVLHVFNATCD